MKKIKSSFTCIIDVSMCTMLRCESTEWHSSVRDVMLIYFDTDDINLDNDVRHPTSIYVNFNISCQMLQ